MELRVKRHVVESDNEFGLVERSDGEQAKEEIYGALKTCDPGTLLLIDFSSIRYIDVACAQEAVFRPLVRILTGEYRRRGKDNHVYMAITGLSAQRRYNIHVVFKLAKRAVVEWHPVKSGTEYSLSVLGEIVPSYCDVLSHLAALKTATAHDLYPKLGLSAVNGASTKLSSLYTDGLLARVEAGKGRAFRYISLV